MEVEVGYQDEEVLIVCWSCNIGFGEATFELPSYKIIDDEGMGSEFCQKVLELVKGELK